MVAIIPVDQPDGTAEERGKAVKLAKRRCISTSDIAYFSAFATPLCLSASCYPSLLFQAIVFTERIVSEWKFQSAPFIFVATFNVIIGRILKLLADINVVIMTVWMGSPQALHTRSCDTAASVVWYGSCFSNLYLKRKSLSTWSVSGCCSVAKQYFLYKAV